MTTQTAKLPRHFYRMPPRPCPYLSGRTEQNIFTELLGPNSGNLYDALSQAGFRRSHNLAYRPACPGCQACIPVRVAAERFMPTKSQRRVLGHNRDVSALDQPPVATVEQYRLFAGYLTDRHDDGEMAGMNFAEYTAMIEDSPLPSYIAEYRDGEGRLLAACLTDQLEDGLSAVYSFFDTGEARRSLGTFIILDLIESTRRQGLQYLYLGYWIRGSRKMAYKERFRPLEALGPIGWESFEVAPLDGI